MLLVWSVILKTGSLLTPSSKWLVCYQILDIPKWRHMMLSNNSQQKVCCQLLLETHIYKMFTRGGGREQLSNSRGFQQIWLSSTRKDFQIRKVFSSRKNYAVMLVTTPHYSGQVEKSKQRDSERLFWKDIYKVHCPPSKHLLIYYWR